MSANMHSDYTGGPAFPVDCSQPEREEGMTLRDYFAAKAMQSFVQGAVLPPNFDATEQLAFMAVRAYETADAMLAARNAK